MKDPLDRQTIIEFNPESGNDLIVPIIFSTEVLEDGYIDRGFAIVTDEPSSEIEDAGHDRSPIFLNLGRANEWINLAQAPDPESILKQKEKIQFKHRLAESA